MDKLKLLLANIENVLKRKGFVKSGNTFYIESNGNWGMLNFQKSKSSTNAETILTINLGVSLVSLRRFKNENIKKKPDVLDCHWGMRIGHLLPQKTDYWWKIDDSNIKEVEDEILIVILNIAIPEILNHLKEGELEKEWLAGFSTGLTELQRYIYLTTLLKLNKSEKLSSIIAQFIIFLKGKAFEEVGNEHLNKLIDEK
ncbi:DUF4304 domain-containing protein [Mucilaginibacter sp. cycad4]|uniref:DUF4304 domain-containing protein n=1 Tax=Mucilaginibacter sp. cycad4 TaxID=3342096 RepID=UPI002AAB448C|nr:DUF4304 domain-containing protein [Mucilaginibacter gossypii]WPU99897.1 DUF4304 domain-containing protein [Mucilaginibacter gossypii]